MGTPLPGTVVPECGAQCGAGTPCSSGGTSTAEMSSLMLNRHTVGLGPSLSLSPPLLPVSSQLPLYILSYRASVQLQVVLNDDSFIN